MSKKIWHKDNDSANQYAKIIEKFTVGEDTKFDLQLAEFDIIGSLAHAEMLETVGLLTTNEWKSVE